MIATRRSLLAFGAMAEFVPLLSPSTQRTLREFYTESNTLQTELSGVLTLDKETSTLIVATSLETAKENVGFSTSTYTVADTDAEDAPFTFHTHPIEVDEDGSVINIPNLISNEDMIGVVQDAEANKGFLSNPHGVNKVDVLVTPIGMFLYAATPGIIDLWTSMEPSLDASDPLREEYIETFVSESPRRGRKSLRSSLQAMDAHQLQAHVAAHPDERNMFFAPVENAFLHDPFEAYIGSYGYYMQGEGVFAQDLVPRFGHLGFSDPSDPSSFDPDLLSGYLDAMRDLGFDVAFIPAE